MKFVFRLVEDRRMGSFQDFIGNLFSPVGRQAVQDQAVGPGQRQKAVI